MIKYHDPTNIKRLIYYLSHFLYLSFIFLFFFILFCTEWCSELFGKNGPWRRAEVLLINYSVGVAPLKIKIGSLSGATWNFFLIRLAEKSGGRRAVMTATGFLPSWRKGHVEEVTYAVEWSKGIRLARSFGSAKRLSPS